MTKKRKPSVRIIPLGGVGEIGKNMMLYEFDERILVVDCGVMFPDEEMPGVDLVIPDMTYLFENRDRVVGVVLTHGHEDHIGGLPYLLREMQPPVYGTKLTLGLVNKRLEEHEIDPDDLDFHEIEPGDTIDLDPFRVETIYINHSIPDALALGIHTEAGTVIHSGDFKFDQTPIDGKTTDVGRFAELGDHGVLALLSDCTNVEKPGFTPSESSVRPALDEAFRTAKRRVIVATFASNIHRVQQIIEVSRKYNRKVAPTGRSMISTIAVARELGYLKVPKDLMIDIEDTEDLPANKVTILTTGAQGEPLSALSRMARQEHRTIKINEGDLVIISATPIPGNEGLVFRTVNQLYHQGAEVVYAPQTPVHVSGHGNQEDLKLMMNLARAKFLIPYHGEYRHLIGYRKLARSMGTSEDRVIIPRIGQTLEVSETGVTLGDKVQTGDVMVDGLGVGDVGTVVLRDRKHLADDGFLLCVVSIDRQTGEVLAGPELITRGFVYVKKSEEFLERARDEVVATLDHLKDAGVTEWNTIRTNVREVLTKFIYRELKRRPMVVPVVMEV